MATPDKVIEQIENVLVADGTCVAKKGVIIPKMNNFITQVIDEDLANGKHNHIITRFPPEPNGWLHLGHAKSICLNFGLAEMYKGQCHLRFDDTNPAAEEHEYIEGIKEDVQWLGFDWGKHLYFASEYFDQFYEWAVKLINDGLAYVDDQNIDEIRANRGSLTEAGKDSPFRNRSAEENLELFQRMRNGEFPEGHCVLRAKIDMASPNMNLRDPLLYRIKKESHPRTGDKWVIYPIYDFAHGQEDSIERITHSICTLEFEAHRPLYDWFQDKLEIFKTRQIEFARFNLSHTVMSKRRLLKLVKENMVRGWDDPRMPTLSGCRRRGYPAAAIRDFAYSVGVAKRENVIPYQKLETYVRDHLADSVRRMAVVEPIRVTITNWDSSFPTDVEIANHPEKPEAGTRTTKFGSSIYIDACDFLENADKNWFRLTVGGEVRLRGAYWMKCNEVVKDGDRIVELKCTIDIDTLGGKNPSDGRKVKGTIQWVGEDSVEAELRLYDLLFNTADPDVGGSWEANLNPDSMKIVTGRVEKCVVGSEIGTVYQFERIGYFRVDEDSTDALLVLNKTVGLQDKFTAEHDADSKAAQLKADDKAAREKAAEERRLKKLAKEELKAKKAAEKAAKKNAETSA